MDAGKDGLMHAIFQNAVLFLGICLHRLELYYFIYLISTPLTDNIISVHVVCVYTLHELVLPPPDKTFRFISHYNTRAGCTKINFDCGLDLKGSTRSYITLELRHI